MAGIDKGAADLRGWRRGTAPGGDRRPGEVRMGSIKAAKDCRARRRR